MVHFGLRLSENKPFTGLTLSDNELRLSENGLENKDLGSLYLRIRIG